MLGMLSVMVLLPIVGALFVFLISRLSEKAARILGLLISITTLLLALWIFAAYRPDRAGFQMIETYSWAESFGLTFTLGIDGISLPLLIISALLTTLSTVGSWREIRFSVGPYYALLLLFQGSITGVFTSLNLILFYVFW